MGNGVRVIDYQVCERFYDNGQLSTRHWHCGPRLHREGGPAFESYDPDGTLRNRSYYVDNQPHRDPAEGPALEEFHPNGTLKSVAYLTHGDLHRDPMAGPALKEFDSDGKCIALEYFVNGRALEDVQESPFPCDDADVEARPPRNIAPSL